MAQPHSSPVTPMMNPFQTLSLDPSIVFQASLMAPVALCLWCSHLIHAGCLPVQHCLPCKQKLGAGPTSISVIFVSSPCPAQAGVY